MRRLLAAAAVGAMAVAACSTRTIDPLQLEQGTVTVSNRTSEPWTGVEIWINRNFRVTTSSIAPDGRFQVSVNSFVAGYGQRFDFARMQIKDVRLTAKTPDGQPIEHAIAFRQGGLEGAFDGQPVEGKAPGEKP
jgi:hypothetical protein